MASDLCWKKPILGSEEKILYQLAVSVTTASHTKGTSVTQMYFSLPIFKRMVVATVSATAARSWLAMPKSGKSWLMPPRGSVTPTTRKYPQAATIKALATRLPGSQEVLAKGLYTLPIRSWSMNRPTRVPASTVVRMKRASNMIAKWYQNACSPPMKAVAFEKMYAIPTASVGAPPVRATILLSPTSLAVCEIVSALTENPRPETADAADSAVPPTT